MKCIFEVMEQAEKPFCIIHWRKKVVKMDAKVYIAIFVLLSPDVRTEQVKASYAIPIADR